MDSINTTNPNLRTSKGSVGTLYLLDRQQTSFINLFQIAREFVENKDPEGKWKDFWAGSVGTTLLQLTAGFSEYNAYKAITARREDYLFEAKQRSSAIAMASTLGYPVFRGKNLHLLITFIPGVSKEIKKFDLIGSMGNNDLISLEEKVIQYGKPTDIQVVVGKLMEESILIPSAKTHWFRFYCEKVSEDILLFLNDKEVPYSRELLSVLEDKFSVITNPVGGIDVLYLNQYPPSPWTSMTKYNFYDYILPNYSWRSVRKYKAGDVVTALADTATLPTYYRAMNDGISGPMEPVWPNVIGEEVTDNNIKWSNIGKGECPLFFKSVTPGQAVSGKSEPNWPNKIGATLKEGDIVWACVNSYTVSKYNYNSGDVLKLMYVEEEPITFESDAVDLYFGQPQVYTIQGKYQEPESLERIRETAPLYHETQHVIRGREDYRKLLKTTLSNVVDTNSHDESPAVVAVTYVKDHTSVTWEPNMLVDKGDEILPSHQNGFIYRALNSGYVASNQHGKSADIEPIWSTTKDSLTEDGQLVWQTLPFSHIANAGIWRARFTYNVGDYVLPRKESEYPGLMFRVDRVNSEPDWPVMIGNKVIDNAVTWECVDTIYLTGYDASYYQTNKQYKVGDFVQPVLTNGYFYKALTQGKSGDTEPDWPLKICSTVIDNEVVWECYDLLESEYYQKNTALRILEQYRPFGIMPPIIKDPVMVHVGLGIYIDANQKIGETKVMEDIKTILAKYQKILALSINITDLENAIETELNYVRVARIYSLENSKVKTWQPGMLCTEGTIVTPSGRPTAPGFSGIPTAKATDYTKTWAGLSESGYEELLYTAKIIAKNLQGKTSGYTAFPDRGISSDREPDWPIVAGGTVKENTITWTMVKRADVKNIPDVWYPCTVYFKGSYAVPTSLRYSNLIAQVTDIAYEEPKWPTIPNKVVKDNEVYWVSFMPQERVLPLSWNEYYIFRPELKLTLRGEEMV